MKSMRNYTTATKWISIKFSSLSHRWHNGTTTKWELWWKIQIPKGTTSISYFICDSEGRQRHRARLFYWFNEDITSRLLPPNHSCVFSLRVRWLDLATHWMYVCVFVPPHGRQHNFIMLNNCWKSFNEIIKHKTFLFLFFFILTQRK